MMSKEIMHGYYSAKADDQCGHCVYKNLKGLEVVVTGVYESKESAEENYLWNDKIYVGEVTEFVRCSERRTSKNFIM